MRADTRYDFRVLSACVRIKLRQMPTRWRPSRIFTNGNIRLEHQQQDQGPLPRGAQGGPKFLSAGRFYVLVSLILPGVVVPAMVFLTNFLAHCDHATVRRLADHML